MVHSWIHLRNDRITEKCLNHRVTRLFRNRHAFFYGDYDLDIYLSPKGDYASLRDAVNRVIVKSGGWVSRCRVNEEVMEDYRSLTRIISEFGRVDDSQMYKFLPRRDTTPVIHSVRYRKDGNFKLLACETEKFYYVFCFATS
jgi:hypothetical protein